MKHANQPEVQLIQSSQRGDKAAFGQLVKHYQTLVCSIAYSHCGDFELSEDLAQEAFIQAWSKLKDLKDAENFKAWLCTIVRNLANRSTKKQAKSIAANSARLDDVAEPSFSGINPTEKLVSAEQEQIVWNALAEIPENYREPMILYYREEQSVARVALLLDLSEDAIKQRLSRGRKMLHQHLDKTLEAVLESSKPTSQFSNAVMVGIADFTMRTSILTGASGSVKAAIASKAIGSFWVPLAQLPLIAWMLKLSLDSTRSDQERVIVSKYILIMFLGIIPLFLLMMAASILIEWPVKFRWVPIPAIMILFNIPMIITSRRLGRKIEQLRIEEGTHTPPRSLSTLQSKTPSPAYLFVGSGLLVAAWPLIYLFQIRGWIIPSVLLGSSVAISLFASRWGRKTPEKAFRAYAISLPVIALILFIPFIFLFHKAVSEGHSKDIGGYLLTLQGSAIVMTVLAMLAWKRVHGKPK